MKKLLLLLLFLLSNFLHSQIILQENFDSLGSPITLPTGWTMTNQSNPLGTATWFRGNTDSFSAFNGPADGYIGVNFQSGVGVSYISNWLMTPPVTVQNGDEVSFYTRIPAAQYPDRLELRMSTLGASSTNPAGNTGVGSYSTLCTSVNPSLTTSGYPITWTKITYIVTGLSGSTSCRFALRYHVPNGGPDGANSNYIGIDAFKIKTPVANEVALLSTNIPRYELMNTTLNIQLNVENSGNNAVNSLKINWNDGVDHEQIITGLNIPSSTSQMITHPIAMLYPGVVEKNIQVTISEVNGVANNAVSNNSLTQKHNTLSSIPFKKVLIEKGTGTWCGWCVRGMVAFNNIQGMFPNEFIGVNVQNGDPMTLAEYDTSSDFSGYPQMHVDRVLKNMSVSQTLMENAINERKVVKVPASLSASGSVSGSNITINAQATFKTVFANANYKFAVIVLENGITGYSQANFYAGGANGPMGGFESLPNPVPASQMVFDKVGRALLGGYNGVAGSVPSSITDGGIYSYTFNYVIPSGRNINNFRAIIILIDGETNEVVNSNIVDLATLSINENSIKQFKLYPNPSTDYFRISNIEKANVVITDVTGKVVLQTEGVDENSLINVSNLNSGIYLVNIKNESMNETIKFVKK
jgi:thiol-disulfide isomerase/thioredoxin